MRRISILFVFCLAVLVLPVMAGESGASALLANPWEEMTAEQLSEASHLSFGVPEGAENVIYRYLRSENLAEMQFTMDDDEYCARIRPATEPTDISGMYYEWENEKKVRIGKCSGTTGQAKDGSGEWAGLCQWYDDDRGLQYSLSADTGDIDSLDLTAVAEQVYRGGEEKNLPESEMEKAGTESAPLSSASESSAA